MADVNHETGLAGWRRWAVPASFLVSFGFNDGEEVLTMARTTESAMRRLPAFVRRLPWIPTGRLTQRQVNAAVAMMGLLYVAAALDGYRSRGRGWLFQDVQFVFGIHGFSHLLSSLVTRGYTSGVATSPTVVIPQWLWARGQLRAAGIPDVTHPVRAAAVVLGWLGVSHVVGMRVADPSRSSAEALRGG